MFYDNYLCHSTLKHIYNIISTLCKNNPELTLNVEIAHLNLQHNQLSSFSVTEIFKYIDAEFCFVQIIIYIY